MSYQDHVYSANMNGSHHFQYTRANGTVANYQRIGNSGVFTCVGSLTGGRIRSKKFNRFKGLITKKPSFKKSKRNKLILTIIFNYNIYMRLRKKVQQVLDDKLPKHVGTVRPSGDDNLRIEWDFVYLQYNIKNINKIVEAWYSLHTNSQ